MKNEVGKYNSIFLLAVVFFTFMPTASLAADCVLKADKTPAFFATFCEKASFPSCDAPFCGAVKKDASGNWVNKCKVDGYEDQILNSCDGSFYQKDKESCENSFLSFPSFKDTIGTMCEWKGSATKPVPDANAATKEAVKKSIEARYKIPDGYEARGGIIPACGFSGQCRDANVLLQIVINIGKYAFSLIGMVAFAAFVYGGFVMIFSFGNADKVKHGKDVMIAAVVGLIIAFSAYAVINFLLDALGVQDSFRGLTK